MKSSIIITAALALSITASAQDIIVKNDSSRIKTNISEINPEYVRYTLFGYQDGPSIMIRVEEIAYITFKNGTSERFTPVPKKEEPVKTSLNQYNLDGSTPQIIDCDPESMKGYERLYKHRNYFGFNYLSLLNSNVSFTYMRDFKKQGLILQVPLSFGIGTPNMTNSVYSGNYLNSGNTTTYNIMNYNIGLGLLFSPSLSKNVNFLIGPSFSFAQYDMSTKATYHIATGVQYQTIEKVYTNNFQLFRQQYGGSMGFLFRFAEHFNMSLMLNVGCKKDTYNEEDPYGVDYINTQSVYQFRKSNNVLPYASFAWTMGYRF
jgi:hypothetical protein